MMKWLLTPTRELVAYEDEEAEIEALMREEGRRLGKEEGEKWGFASAHEELKSLMQLLHAIADKLLEQKTDLLMQLKPEIVDFTLKVAEQIIRKELVDPEVHTHLIHALLHLASKHFAHETLTIYLAPDDLSGLEKHLVGFPKQITFLSDHLMQRGDCRIEATSGLLNAEITRQLEELYDKIAR